MATILIIDDEPSVRLSLKQALSLTNHTVVLAESAREGFTTIATVTPDLLLVDMFMPDVDGVETIRQVRKSFPAMKIIAMSGNPLAPEILQIAHHLGAAAVLEKPFALGHLLKLVNDALSS